MKMVRYVMLSGAVALFAAAGPKAVLADWKDAVPVIRIGILGGENEADRLKNYTCFAEIIKEELGVPAELYPAADYAGVMQGLISNNLEVAGLGSSAYAGIYLQAPDAVEPLVTTKQVDGSLGYYSVMMVRADSPYESIDDLEDKTLAFADPNSTSGYLVPSAELKLKGYDPDAFFGETGFAGGHEQGIVALLNEQYDAAVTWTSGVGKYEEGYSRGNLRKMVDKGALDMSDVRIVWQSEMITNGPRVIRKDVPDELKQAYKQLLLDLPERDKPCFEAISGGKATGFEPIGHEFYERVIEMRRQLTDDRRS